jgi:hypothetical protein
LFNTPLGAPQSVLLRHNEQPSAELTKYPLWHLPEIFMTLQAAKSIARHLGLTLRQLRSGNYRVNFRDGNETTAYYTGNLEDAVNTAVEMARKRAL